MSRHRHTVKQQGRRACSRRGGKGAHRDGPGTGVTVIGLALVGAGREEPEPVRQEAAATASAASRAAPPAAAARARGGRAGRMACAGAADRGHPVTV